MEDTLANIVDAICSGLEVTPAQLYYVFTFDVNKHHFDMIMEKVTEHLEGEIGKLLEYQKKFSYPVKINDGQQLKVVIEYNLTK